MDSGFIIMIIGIFFLAGLFAGFFYMTSVQKKHYTKKYKFTTEASERIEVDQEILYNDEREEHSNKDY